MFKLKFIFIQLVLVNGILFAQQTNLPLNFEIQNSFEKSLLKSEKLIFTAHRPFLHSDIQDVLDVDSVYYRSGRDKKMIAKLKHPLWWKKLRTEDLISVDKAGFQLRINPLIHFSTGRENIDNNPLMINTRGVDVSGSLGSEFSFGSGVYENQAVYPSYYTEFVRQRRVVPGQGRARVYKEKGFDFSRAYGYLSYSPSKMFNFQIGHGKHFIGEGYRSLILSDNAYNMPYFKFTTTWKWMRYTNLLLAYQGSIIADGGGEISNRRYGSFTSLDFLIGNIAEVGITESIVWKKKDSLAYFPNPNLLNPFILYRTAQYGMNGVNNVLLGINAKVKISKSILSYAQMVFDDKEKISYQIGMKWYDVFKLPLYFQIEYNMVKPYTYTHYQAQNYTHYNQELAHPLGANLSEILTRVRYRWKDVILSYQFNYAKQGLDEQGVVYGNNLFLPYRDLGNLKSGNYLSISNHSIKLSYLINPSSNLQVFFENRIRNYQLGGVYEIEKYWLFGIKTNLQNLYSDF